MIVLSFAGASIEEALVDKEEFENLELEECGSNVDPLCSEEEAAAKVGDKPESN